MAEKFIGAQVRAGEFTAKDTGRVIAYNNLVLFTTSVINCGEQCNDAAKITNTGENIVKVFGRPITMDWLRAQLGKYVAIFYDKYKKVERVMFFDKDPDADLYNMNPTTINYSLPVDVTSMQADDGALKEDIPQLSSAAEEITSAPDTSAKGGKK